MLTHSGILANSLWAPSRRPIFFPLFRCFSISTNDFTSTSSTEASCVDEDSSFLPWLERKAKAKISTALSIGMSSHGRTLYSSKNIETGDCLLEVPFSVQLSPENIRPDFSKLIKDEVGSVARVAVVILFEKKLGRKSEWWPYISRLPLPQDMHSSIFWSDEELEMIRPSCLYEETLKQKKSIENDFLGVKLVFDEFPHLFQYGVSLKEFTYAYQLVKSRAWDSPKGVSLIPFADFLNHDNASGAYLFGDEHKQHSEITADCDYAVGDEVRIRYGKFSNATLVLDYGFALSDNIWDFFRFDLNIPQDDELYAQKFDILRDLRAPSMKEDNEFTSSWNSFKIKGKVIPLPLRAFARILVCDSRGELDGLREEAAQSDGRVARYPLKKKERELAAHQVLHDELSKLIERHNEHIKLLVTTTPGKSAVRRQLAQDLLQGELRVMKSARDWLANYCFKIRANW